jgi:hypothetical protein
MTGMDPVISMIAKSTMNALAISLKSMFMGLNTDYASNLLFITKIVSLCRYFLNLQEFFN